MSFEEGLFSVTVWRRRSEETYAPPTFPYAVCNVEFLSDIRFIRDGPTTMDSFVKHESRSARFPVQRRITMPVGHPSLPSRILVLCAAILTLVSAVSSQVIIRERVSLQPFAPIIAPTSTAEGNITLRLSVDRNIFLRMWVWDPEGIEHAAFGNRSIEVSRSLLPGGYGCNLQVRTAEMWPHESVRVSFDVLVDGNAVYHDETVMWGTAWNIFTVWLNSFYYDPVDSFAVWTTPDTIDAGGVATVEAAALHEDGTPSFPDGELPVNIFLSAGETSGLLARDGVTSSQFLSVPVWELFSNRILFVAAAQPPDTNTTVRIGVTLASSPDVSGVGTVVIRGVAPWDFKRLSQGDPAWALKAYDSYVKSITGKDTVYHTIGRKGCALTSIAMALTAAGYPIHPDELNTFMKAHGGYNEEAGVVWGSPDALPGNDKLEYVTGGGKGLTYIESLAKSVGTPVKLADIDAQLAQTRIVIAQVLNPSSKRAHWVVIRQASAGSYRILDPGYLGRETLSQYGGNIYKWVSYGIPKSTGQ